MKQKRMSLADLQGNLTGAEMKKIMAGSDTTCDCNYNDECTNNKTCQNACNGPKGGKWGVCKDPLW